MGTYISKLKDFEKGLNFKKKGITITVSGKTGVGKTVISKTLAKIFKLKHVSAGDIFRAEAKRRKLALEEFSKIREPEIDIELDKRTLELAKKGNVVLNGRLTGWVAGDNADIRMWVKAPMRLKAKRVAKRDKLTIKEAKEKIKKRDEYDAKVYKKLYGIDINDTSIYNLIITNGDIPLEKLKKLVVSKVKKLLGEKR
ncbi:MAG: cytidylate kinase family protein [Nanoarchaeota archaeon]|nr:cytidylate kinase family protein [Nanoarchaeota archaeon]